MAVGEMGLSPEMFNSMTPAEFILAQYGYLNKKQAEARQAWEIARFSTYAQIIIHIDKKHRKSPQEMFPFAWDEQLPKKKQKQLTPEERLERVRKIQGK